MVEGQEDWPMAGGSPVCDRDGSPWKEGGEVRVTKRSGDVTTAIIDQVSGP